MFLPSLGNLHYTMTVVDSGFTLINKQCCLWKRWSPWISSIPIINKRQCEHPDGVTAGEGVHSGFPKDWPPLCQTRPFLTTWTATHHLVLVLHYSKTNFHATNVLDSVFICAVFHFETSTLIVLHSTFFWESFKCPWVVALRLGRFLLILISLR